MDESHASTLPENPVEGSPPGPEWVSTEFENLYLAHSGVIYYTALRLLGAQASPRVLISDDVVPFRPNKGIYLIVEEVDGSKPQDEHLQRLHTDVLPELVSVPGVAGALAFATSPAIRRPTFTPGAYRITACYLDEDPATVGASLAPVLERFWKTAPGRPLLAAPFESMMIWDWDRFGPAGPPPA